MDLNAYLERLASAEPTPGGGSAATIVAALAASLVAMVARITLANPAHASVASAASIAVRDADDLREQLLAARLEDETAYGRVVDAMALPRATVDEKVARTGAVQRALGGAADAPLRAAALAVRALELACEAGALGNAHLASDVACAETFARAALAASAANVRINHAFMRDAELVAVQEGRLRDLELRANACAPKLDAGANRGPGTQRHER